MEFVLKIMVSFFLVWRPFIEERRSAPRWPLLAGRISFGANTSPLVSRLSTKHISLDEFSVYTVDILLSLPTVSSLEIPAMSYRALALFSKNSQAKSLYKVSLLSFQVY